MLGIPNTHVINIYPQEKHQYERGEPHEWITKHDWQGKQNLTGKQKMTEIGSHVHRWDDKWSGFTGM